MKTTTVKKTDILILEFPNLRIKKAERDEIANSMSAVSGLSCIVLDKECNVTIIKSNN